MTPYSEGLEVEWVRRGTLIMRHPEQDGTLLGLRPAGRGSLVGEGEEAAEASVAALAGEALGVVHSAISFEQRIGW